MRLILGGILFLAVAGCRPDAPPSPAAPLPARTAAWEAEAARLNGLVRLGMTKDEVVRVLGEPKEARGSYGSRNRAYWLYPLTSNLYFRVDFDERELVENRRAWSGLPGPQ